MKSAVVLPGVILLGLISHPALGLSRQDQQTFVEEILFQKKFLSNGAHVVRWDRQPTLSLMSGSEREKTAIDYALLELERPLRPVGYHVRRLPDGSTDADIEIYHTRYSKVPGLLDELGLGARFAELDKAHAFYNEDGSLEKVYVFLDSRLATTDSAMQRRALKIVLASLGLPGETRIPVQSIFYEVPPLGIAEEAPSKLYPIDIRAIRLLYAYLNPGDSLERMREKFGRQWRRL